MSYICIFLTAAASSFVFTIGLQICTAADAELQKTDKRKQKAVKAAVFCFLVFAAVLKAPGGVRNAAQSPDCIFAMLEGLFWASLALAAYSDYCTTSVFDFVFLPGIFADLLCLVWNWGSLSLDSLLGFGIFLVFQWLIFQRLYGGADCLAFSACGLHLLARQRISGAMVGLMALTFLFLVAVQGMKRNINKKGNLKKEVPLIPYIAAAMLLI